MIPLSVNLDASALEYLEEKAKSIFGKDSAAVELGAWLKGLQSTAMSQARFVQCVGMHKPIDFHAIYQPTSLAIRSAIGTGDTYAYQNRVSRSISASHAMAYKAINIEDFFEDDNDSIIYAGPGWGKTTFLHSIYRRYVDSTGVYPLLITLRRPTALEDLNRFVAAVEKITKKQRQNSVLLLVDGYDEIPLAQRKLVSEYLLRFQGLGVGKFYLTCREYYDVINLSASEVRVGGFTIREKYKFVEAFLKAFESRIDPKSLVNELEDRGFTEFLSHPLLLALACIVKTSPGSSEPRSALRLLERAIEVLRDRWDQSKGLSREAFTPLDGRDRIQVLKRIAFIATTSYIQSGRAETAARTQIDLLNFDKIDPHKVLLETAQFYGILVPCDGGWEFVHRTVHDFLAALYWVETGAFASVKSHSWTARTAYAACLTQDASAIFQAALSAEQGLPVVAEMLSNGAPMSVKLVAQALKVYFSKSRRVEVLSDPGGQPFTATLASDFIRGASTRLLDRLVDEYSKSRNNVTDAICAYCLLELKSRGQKLDFVTYESVATAYKEDFTMQVPGLGRIMIGEMNPRLIKSPLLEGRKKSISG
jgi:hypothetical protein